MVCGVLLLNVSCHGLVFLEVIFCPLLGGGLCILNLLFVLETWCVPLTYEMISWNLLLL